ncbi:MAG: M81 family metallopeptidase, partial [Armatimonadia bacterium]
MRIATAGFLHETNTFADGLTTLADYERSGGFPGLMVGEEMLRILRGTAVCSGGFIAAAEAAPDIELVPLLWTFPQPSG